MKCLNDFVLKLKNKEFAPLMLGGMGVDISTADLAVAFANNGAIGHISDALTTAVADKNFKTTFVRDRLKKFKFNKDNDDKNIEQFDLDDIRRAQKMHVKDAMSAKKGNGGIFINCMEKLTMNNPRDTLKARLESALDAGIDGITLSAGLHMNSLNLIKNHPRFNDAILGIIVSSTRALKIFLKKAQIVSRLPDFIVVEGPKAGGHLGFGMDWADFNLKKITQEVIDYLKNLKLSIPIIPAGGIFNGKQAVEYMNMGCSAVQVATRFTVSVESGLPDKAKQAYFTAKKEDIIVNYLSPTGYPMRMLKQSPVIGSGLAPNCESYGYLLDKGRCSYIDSYNKTKSELKNPTDKVVVTDKMCICTQMRKYNVWTCGVNTYKLKKTSKQDQNGNYILPPAKEIIDEYLYSK
ncbi:MAG: nitronate monooxygenase [Gammaproteobacteria bacterium]|nr:MAG: nitronate monooxygenase [Gammaproteobacteria bacterium]